MQFDWTTFLLELLNFLVLLWLLKHFFYQPVLAVLDRRRQGVLDEAARAAALQREAQDLKTQYEQRLQAWQTEQEQARHALAEDIARERARQLDQLKQALAEERAKDESRLHTQEQQRTAKLVREAAATAYAQAAAMLQRLAGDALTERIVEIVAEDLIALPETERKALQEAAAALPPDAQVEIASAHPLPDASRRILSAALEQAAGQSLRIAVSERPELIAGLRIALGECLLRANLAEELEYFRRGAQEGGDA